MKVVILAGGRGTRFSEETDRRPKPMVEVGGKPMLWHIMSIYAAHGFKDFLVACGHQAECIKQYFHDFFVHNSDYTIDLADGSLRVLSAGSPDWRVGVIDTGIETMTAGRILRLRSHIGDSAFMVTYGDGVADVDIAGLAKFHRSHGKVGTVTAVRPPARFGSLGLTGDTVSEFSEKPQTGEGWINGGFFVFDPSVFDRIHGDESILERDALRTLATDGELKAFRHTGFWQPMDTLREKQHLESLWVSGKAPWKIWT